MLSHLKRQYHPRHKPLLSRQSYTREMIMAATTPVAGSLSEGAVVSVLAKQVFQVTPTQFAMIMAVPMFANLTSFVWSKVAHGEPKIRTINRLQFLMILCIAMIGLLPPDPGASWSLIMLLLIARCLIAGIITLRSTLWRNNYPRAVRGKITSQFVQVAVIVIAISPLIGFFVLDYEPTLYRVLYPICAMVAVIGAVSFSGVRLRREKELLRHELRSRPRRRLWRLQPRGETVPMYVEDETELETPAPARSPGVFKILKQDKRFRLYMVWCFFADSGNMIGEVATVWLILQLANQTTEPFGISVLFNNTIPMLVTVASLPFWARLVDRMNITQFRVYNGFWWILAEAIAFVCATQGLLWVWVFQRVCAGILRGGGVLAWELGHNEFADRKLVSTYMGINVTLAGIRGATMPFIATFLIAGMDSSTLLGFEIPAWNGIGPYVFLLSMTLCIVAHLGYRYMIRIEAKKDTAEIPHSD